MADLDFPSNPSFGDTHTGDHGHQWMWDGIKWVGLGAGDGVIGAAFLPIVGGTMQGQIGLPDGTLAQPTLSFGTDGTGLSRTGNAIAVGVQNAMNLALLPGGSQFYTPVNVLNNKVTQVADPTDAQDAVNKRYAEGLVPNLSDYARLTDLLDYLRRDGGSMTGPLITARGTNATNPGIGIGDNATGFYRSGNALGLAVSGEMYMQFLAAPQEVMAVKPLNMAVQRITNLANATAASDAVSRSFGDARYLQLLAGGIVQGPLQVTLAPQIDNDAANKLYVDQRRAPTLLTTIPSNVGPITGNFVNLAPITYPIPRGGNSRILVSVNLQCTAAADAQIMTGGIRLDLFPAAGTRSAFLYQTSGACGDLSGQFFVDVSGNTTGLFNVQVALMGGATNGFNILAGSQIAVVDLGPI